MSFDVYLARFQRGEEVAAVNPGLIRGLLNAHLPEGRKSGPDDYYCDYEILFEDGGVLEFNNTGLDPAKDLEGCSFRVRGLSPGASRFMYQVACMGDMVIFNAQGRDDPDGINPLAIAVSASQRAHVPPGVARFPVHCRSADEFHVLLLPSYSGWTDYRARIVSGRRD